MKVHSQGGQQDNHSDPRGTPNTTPNPGYGGVDHSFTLQAIMELQKSNGQLTESINSLKQSIESTSTKMDKIEDCVSGIEKKVYAAGVVIVICLAIGGFIINKAVDAWIQYQPKTEQTANDQSKDSDVNREPSTSN